MEYRLPSEQENNKTTSDSMNQSDEHDVLNPDHHQRQTSENNKQFCDPFSCLDLNREKENKAINVVVTDPPQDMATAHHHQSLHMSPLVLEKKQHVVVYSSSLPNSVLSSSFSSRFSIQQQDLTVTSANTAPVMSPSEGEDTTGKSSSGHIDVVVSKESFRMARQNREDEDDGDSSSSGGGGSGSGGGSGGGGSGGGSSPTLCCPGLALCPNPSLLISQEHKKIIDRLRADKFIRTEKVYQAMLHVNFANFGWSYSYSDASFIANELENCANLISDKSKVLVVNSWYYLYVPLCLCLMIGEKGGCVVCHGDEGVEFVEKDHAFLLDAHRLILVKDYGWEEFMNHGYPIKARYDLILVHDKYFSDELKEQLKSSGIAYDQVNGKVIFQGTSTSKEH